MKYYRSNNPRYLPLYDISRQINPGQVLELTEEQAVAAKRELDFFISRKDVDEVDDTAGPIAVAPIRKVNPQGGVVLPDNVQNQDTTKIGVVHESLASDNDSGSVIIPGEFPGEGKVITVDAAVAAKLEEAKKLTETLGEELAKMVPPKEAPKVEYPTDLQNWFTLRHAQKKIELVHTSDVTRLNYITTYDKNEKIQKLIAQRLKELEKGAENESEVAKPKSL